MAKYTLAKTLLLAGTSFAAGAKDESNQKLRGAQSQRGLYQPVNPVVPPPTPSGWRNDGFDRIDTPAPTDGWAGDAHQIQPLPAPVSKGNSKLVYVNVSEGSFKSTKGYGINVSGVSGSKSDKGFGLNVSGSKSNKGYGLKVSGGSSKSDKGGSSKSNKGSGISGKSGKGYGINVSGSKSDKGYGLNVSGGSSKSKGYGIAEVYGVNLAGKSNKGSSGILVNIEGGETISSINNAWHDDGFFEPSITRSINSAWHDDGFEPLITPSPTAWKGDAFEPLPAPVRNDWSDDGWDDDKYPAPLNPVTGDKMYYVNINGAKSNKVNNLNVSGSGSKSNKGYGINVSGSKSEKGNGLNASGTSSKSNKGYGINVSGSKSEKGSGLNVSGGKSNKGYGINVSGSSSKSKGSGIYINVAGGSSKSKGSFTTSGAGSKANKGTPAQPVNPIQPADGWNNDGHVPVPVPVVRGKWSGDGHVTPLVTPNPTPYPTWKGDAHIVTPPPTWKGDAYPPTNKPVVPITTPAPTICEERMLWHPNTDYTICTNDNNFDSDSEYIYESLQMCCMSVFGTLSCDFNDVCNTPSPSVSPVTPAPTPCEAQVFFFDGNVCSNEIYVADAPAYKNVMFCCNMNFGAGSYMNGSCEYVDVCNTLEPTPNPTKSPSKKPTNAPIEPIVTPSPVTPAPTPCEAQVFFFDGNVCSNEFYIADAPAYTSVMICCNMNFGAGSFMNGSCEYVDVCNTLPPSPSPVTPEPTPSPVTPAPTPCEAQVFFFDGNVCSNKFYIADAQAYTSVMICCNMNFGAGSYMNGSCEYVDECNTLPPSPSPVTPKPTMSPVTPAPTPCEAQVFYFDGNVCSNEFIIADASAYNSAVACCNVNFGMGSFASGECNYVDECNTLPPSPSPITPEPTPAPIEPIVTPSPATPAPTPCEALLFFFDGDACSNEFYIADASSYETAKACCNANFGTGSFMTGSCNYIDTCNTLPPSPAPTIISTFGSTPTVSKETTGPPTMAANRGDDHKVTVDVTTDCREITGGYPVVCVKVCTSIKSKFKGGVLIDETAETTEEECD